MTNIETRWHRVLACLQDDNVVVSTEEDKADPIDELPPNIFDRAQLRNAIDLFNSAPKYYFDKRAMQFLMDHPTQVTNSLFALAEAGVARLPFPYLVAEFEWGAPNIILCSESKRVADARFRLTPMQTMRLHRGQDVLILSPQTLFASAPYKDAELGAGIHWKVFPAGWLKQNDASIEFSKKSVEYWKQACTPAIVALLVLLNTRGIKREHVEAPVKLNKERIRRNRFPIPSHTVIRIGHVYNKSGKAVTLDEHDRRKQPLHYRSGYTAMRWITKAHEKFDPEKANDMGRHEHLVFVEPYIVNYDPESGELPDIPERRVTW